LPRLVTLGTSSVGRLGDRCVTGSRRVNSLPCVCAAGNAANGGPCRALRIEAPTFEGTRGWSNRISGRYAAIQYNSSHLALRGPVPSSRKPQQKTPNRRRLMLGVEGGHPSGFPPEGKRSNRPAGADDRAFSATLPSETQAPFRHAFSPSTGEISANNSDPRDGSPSSLSPPSHPSPRALAAGCRLNQKHLITSSYPLRCHRQRRKTSGLLGGTAGGSQADHRPQAGSRPRARWVRNARLERAPPRGWNMLIWSSGQVSSFGIATRERKKKITADPNALDPPSLSAKAHWKRGSDLVPRSTRPAPDRREGRPCPPPPRGVPAAQTLPAALVGPSLADGDCACSRAHWLCSNRDKRARPPDRRPSFPNGNTGLPGQQRAP